MIRSIWAALNLFLATFTLSAAAVIAAFLRARPGVFDTLSRTWSLWMLRTSGVRVRIEGMENLRADEPQIVVSNHQSWYDVWALAGNIPGRYHFVAKKELAHIPVFGRAWQAAGHISIDRSDTQSAIRSLQDAGRVLREQHGKVVIFAEGTRSKDGRLQPFKKGAFMLAIHSGVEIVPTAVIGSRSVLPKGGWRVRAGEIIVRFGAPVSVVGIGEGGRDALIARVRHEIQTLMETPTGSPPRRPPLTTKEEGDVRDH